MTSVLKATISAVLFSICATSANAAVVTLGTIDKAYGSATDRGDKASTGGTSCDKLNATSITIYDGGVKNCGRFYDIFDFSGMNYKSIDSLKLTLDFSNTNNVNYFVIREDWRMIIADANGNSSKVLLDMNNSTGAYSQSFMINAATHASIFANISDSGKFQMWFGDEAAGANNFNLYSARLEVKGTEVPEPSSIALVGISLLGAALARRRKALK